MKKALWIVVPIGIVLGGWYAYSRAGSDASEIEFRYAPVTKGEIVRSISATGQLKPLTTVDVKSKAGGRVVKLAVDEGARVKKGDLIAIIDPSDTQAQYDQAAADLRSASARAEQAKLNYELQTTTSETAVSDAEANLKDAKSRLQRAELEAKRQPALAESSLKSAQAAQLAADQELKRFETVTAPQQRRDTTTSLQRAKTSLDSAQASLDRQQELLTLGYVSQAAVDQARSSLASARAEFAQARQKADTLEEDLAASLKSKQFDLDRANAALDQAKSNTVQKDLSARDLEEAHIAVTQAEISLKRAMADRTQVLVKKSDIAAAEASAVRSQVSVQNAKVQLDSTTVLAPRDGVVTLKYLEEGTIIPPGTSTFAQGTSLVQISDVTEMYVECAVDEADFAAVNAGQTVRVVAEAFPSDRFSGVVDRVSPAATTDQSVTAVKVRVKIDGGANGKLLPGMNATCEFITLSLPDRLTVPAQAINHEGDRTFVKVKSADPYKPAVRDVEIGESGNDGVEVKNGLAEGEEVVVGEINLKEMRETQKRMAEAAQGGGLAGGTMGRPRSSSSGRGGSSSGGRSGGGMSGGGSGASSSGASGGGMSGGGAGGRSGGAAGAGGPGAGSRGGGGSAPRGGGS